MAFFAMVLTFLFGLSFLSVPVAASHLSDGDISLMTPMEYVQGNWTQYFKNWLGLYEADNHEVRGIRVDLPTYLHYQWFDVREDEHLSCLLEEDCEMPPKDDLTVGGVNNVTEEVSHCRTPIDHPLNTQQEVTGRYAILKQLTNFHHQHKWMAEKTLEDEVSTLGSISSLAKQSSYTDEMDQWREGEYWRSVSGK